MQGRPAMFTVVATGSPSYQWQRNGQDISGATAACVHSESGNLGEQR
jgi:hypothetical protein